MGRGTWQAAVHGFTNRQTRLKQLNMQAHHLFILIFSLSWMPNEGKSNVDFSGLH